MILNYYYLSLNTKLTLLYQTITDCSYNCKINFNWYQRNECIITISENKQELKLKLQPLLKFLYKSM